MPFDRFTDAGLNDQGSVRSAELIHKQTADLIMQRGISFFLIGYVLKLLNLNNLIYNMQTKTWKHLNFIVIYFKMNIFLVMVLSAIWIVFSHIKYPYFSQVYFWEVFVEGQQQINTHDSSTM